ncbi:1-(5-phosphoribosyl)-5-[(5-phosphoribosylamino)methylideneamino]imidazole-4-carboxamide isomerase [Blattabacterium cuenoti]|uniref:1-(5-phosphoribosyl)-5-[(5- phosphoribosylamino)methylideneamino]imidazole-4- carboxamide isomerase n=1 Tax=Blattabacterium cuenoti TaxID=1653831 RepID=UPI00163D2BA6|nr:1-(5-phosphoribosyl)-5-[(5-phosphoribosylamino)methylideneamino]imidazole-4-carboxamide isomerase [Blattabacterium cuenoti]
MNNIIVAIDLIDGKCVRLIQGNFQKKKIYNNDPLDVAYMLEDNGISRLHLVDLDGAREGKIVHWKTLEKIAKNTHLTIDFGGGICTENDVKTVFENGGHMVSVGSIAVKKPIFLKNWIDTYGPDKILLGVDIKNKKIAINGWKILSNIPFWDFLKKKEKDGIRTIFCTDISKDGVLSGPSFSLYSNIIKKFPKIKLIASGGVSSIEDIKNLFHLGCHGVIIGKAIYEKRISLLELRNWK